MLLGIFWLDSAVDLSLRPSPGAPRLNLGEIDTLRLRSDSSSEIAVGSPPRWPSLTPSPSMLGFFFWFELLSALVGSVS